MSRFFAPWLVLLSATALVLGAGVPFGHAATTTAEAPKYDYEYLAAFAHGARGLPGSPASVNTRAQRDLAPVRVVERPGVAAEAGTSVVKYDADFALSQLTRSGSGKASELIDFATRQGWTRSQTATGPIKFVDNNGVTRLTIKSGSPRAPGSNFPHVEVRNAAGQRVDPYGNAVTRRSPGNHTPIEWDVP